MFKDLKVLIVEDSMLVQKQINLAFKEAGFTMIDQAYNGVEALEKCEEALPDIISIDIIMPEMHGIDLFRQIKNLYPNVKCLFITCLRSDQLNDAFPGEIEPFQFIEKPVSAEIISNTVRMLYESPKSEDSSKKSKEEEAHLTQGA